MTEAQQGKQDNSRALLLVEDNMDHALLARHALKACPALNVEIARTGAEALSHAKSRRFDVWVIDYRLPDCEGLGLCRRLRKLGVAARVIFVSASASEWVAAKAFEAGADDFITKGNDYPRRLTDAVRQSLGDADS